jgi:AcrR family transcriptional regulator
MRSATKPKSRSAPEAAADNAPAPFGLRERNKRDKLNRIKGAARKLFISKGFDDATMREIAARAGVGLGTVFLYAADKRDLLFLIANEGLEEAEAAAEAAVQPAASLIENLIAVFSPQYAFFAQQPALSRLVLREMTFFETGEQARVFQKTRDSLIALVGKTVSLAMAQGNIASTESPQLIGWAIFCIFQLELRRWFSGDDLDLQHGLEQLRRTLNVCITGLAPASRPRPRSRA